MNGTLTLPGPETLILFGVHVKVLSALFGVLGAVLGHFMAPVPETPLTVRRQSMVLAANVLVAVALTVATGQRPLLVLGWCIGIGFAGITIYQGWGEKAKAAGRTLSDAALVEIKAQLEARKAKR